MYHIAVFDDETQWCDRITSMTASVMGELGIRHTITAFSSYRDIWTALQSGVEFQLYLLDILSDGPQGLKLARYLRGLEQTAGIIFISSSSDFVFEGYDVQAIKYLLKPPDRDQLKAAILYDYKNRFLVQNHVLRFTHGSQVFSCFQQELVYLESLNRKVFFHLSNGHIAILSGKLSDYEGELPPDWFARCHISYCVNLFHVSGSEKKFVILKSMERIPVSRKYSNSFRVYMLRVVK